MNSNLFWFGTSIIGIKWTKGTSTSKMQLSSLFSWTWCLCASAKKETCQTMKTILVNRS